MSDSSRSCPTPTDIPNVDDVPNVPVSKRPLPDPPGWSPTPLGAVSRGPLTLPYYVDPATSGPPDTYFLQCERLFRIHNVPRHDWVPLIVHQFIGCSRFVVERHFRSSVSDLPVDTTYQALQSCLVDFCIMTDSPYVTRSIPFTTLPRFTYYVLLQLYRRVLATRRTPQRYHHRT